METLTPLIFKLPPKRRALTFTQKLYKVQFNKPLLYDLLTWNPKGSRFLYCCAPLGFAARKSEKSLTCGEFQERATLSKLVLVCVTRSLTVLSRAVPQMNISACILAQVAAQKWLRHWKAIMNSESCWCVSSFPPLCFSVAARVIVSRHLFTHSSLVKEPSLIPLPSQLKRAGLFS